MKTANRFVAWFLISFTVMSTLGMTPAPADEPEIENSSNLLQYIADGHVLGFAPQGMYAAAGSHILRVSFVNVNNIQPQADLPVRANINDKAAPLNSVLYINLWDGISVNYAARADGIYETTYTVAPGADPQKIRLHYNAPLTINKNGTLDISFETGVLTESAPLAWQEILGKHVPVNVAFHIQGQDVSFFVGEYDPNHVLMIDPVLAWNTFLGGGGADDIRDIVLDGAGNIYVAGVSSTTWGCTFSDCTVRNYTAGFDVFVAKLNSTGNLVWNTFLSGNGSFYGDYSASIALDSDGKIYVAGTGDGGWGCSPASCTVLPYSGEHDAFVAQLDPSGNLIWNTFLGWSGMDSANDIVLDNLKNIYISGGGGVWGCKPPASPCTVLPYTGSADVFVAKLDSVGNLIWNTYLDESIGWTYGTGIVGDGNGNVYVTGTSSTPWGNPVRAFSNYPITVDAFVAKVDTNGNLIWNTFLGGDNHDYGGGISLDGANNVYVSGDSSQGWGSPVRAFGKDSGYFDIYVAKLDINGNLIWNTFLGGDSHDNSSNISADDGGNIYITGGSLGIWGNPIETPPGAGTFSAKLNTNGALLWNTFLGAAGTYGGGVITIGENGPLFVAAKSRGSWGNPVIPFTGGDGDGFVAKLNIPLLAVSSVRSNPSPTAANLVDFTVLFSEAISAIDISDFNITTTGNISGASVIGVSVSGAECTVTVDTGTGSGTIHLDVKDDDSVIGEFFHPLGGQGVGNGNFTAGETYEIDKNPRTVVSSALKNNPIDGGDIEFTVTFSEPVTGVGLDDFSLATTGISDPYMSSISGSGTTYQVGVNYIVGLGTIRLDVNDNDSILDGVNLPLGGLGSGNGSFINGEVVRVSSPKNLIKDPSFDYYTPNPYWREISTNFGTPICLLSVCGTGAGSAGPYFGNAWSWFGGTNLNENSSLSQTIVIPSSYTKPKLRFFFWIGLAQKGSDSADVFTASIDGTTVFSANALQQNGYPIYTPITIDVSALADDQAHTIKFSSVTTGQVVNFNLDDVYLTNFTFNDVFSYHWAWQYIERMYNAGVTGGCSTPPLQYCPDNTVTRAQMAVFILKGMHGSSYTPPAVGASTGFTDVATDYWAAAWIKQLAAEGITGGCGGGNYCPDATVTRAQMAIFLLKAKHGLSYSPPAAIGVFTDVPVGYWADKWIEQLAVEGVTSGCGGSNYCPDAEVTRAQMAVFLVKAFNLP